MIPAGCTAKKVSPRPDWLPAEAAVDILSASEWVSKAFGDDAAHWRHNGYWLVNSPAEILDIAWLEGVDLGGHTLFSYEVCEQQYEKSDQTLKVFALVAGIDVAVPPPQAAELRGFDVVSFSCQSSHECSPLSCRRLAESIAVNAPCLRSSLDEAMSLVEKGKFDPCEPGPYRIYAVYFGRTL